MLYEVITGLNIDQIVCLGDVVGYNANPNECCTILRNRGTPPILSPNCLAAGISPGSQ